MLNMHLHSGRLPLATSITLFVGFLLFPSTAFSLPSCTSPPLVIPVTNVTLSTGSQRRGLPLAIGTPAQSFSLKAAMSVNNTIFKQGPLTSSNCDHTTNSDNRCIMGKGGIYNRDSSSTWSGPMTKQEFLIGGATDNYKSIDTVGQETLHISGQDIKDFPLGIDDTTAFSTSTIGLGTNSSLITTLLDKGVIPSRVWGLDWGWTGSTADTWADGSLVLGGYDKSRVKDNKLYSQDFPATLGDSDGCDLIVYITGISMKNDTNEVQLLESKGDSLRSCVTSEYDLITLPYSLFTIFNNAMGDVYLNRSVGAFSLWGFESDVTHGYKGTMEIKLSNGLSVTIPNHELIQPYRDLNHDGVPVITNPNKNVLMLNSLQQANEKDLPLLGLPFLSSTYLVVDPDKGQFLLGESQRSTTPELVAGALSSCPENSASSPSGVQSTALPVSPSNSSPPSGAVIGGSVGGAAAVAVISALAFFLRRRSKNRKVQEAIPVERVHMIEEVPGELEGNMHTPGEDQQKTHPYELSSDAQSHSQRSPIYEADSDPIPRYTDGTNSIV